MKYKIVLTCILVLNALVIIAQEGAGGGAHPGFDGGLSVPVDGGLLMALLAGGGLTAMLFKKDKKKDL